MVDQIQRLVNDQTLNDSDKTFTVPAKTEWDVLSLHVTYGSTATVGNRQVTVVIFDNLGRNQARFAAGLVQAASLTRYYTFAPGNPHDTAAFDNSVQVPMAHMRLPAGWQIQVLDAASVDTTADDMEVFVYGTASVSP